MNFGASLNINAPSPYWSPNNNSQNQSSALGYVPETTWNESCTNNIFVLLRWGGTPEASCNNSQLPPVFVSPLGGGGGKSSCTSSNGTASSTCAGGYTKPAWQSAPGVPKDGARDIPDVSLFASAGFTASAYIVCEADQPSPHGSCSLNSPNDTFLPVGGTSVSAPAFAGILALVNQSTGSSWQGNANYVLYKLASSSAQTSQSCGATSSPASRCIFYDVTSGTIAEPCAKSSPDCNFSNASDTYGILTGYNAESGYDLATGLGSVNANNLVHNWIQPTLSSATTLSLNSGRAVSITHGQSIPYDISVAPSAATGAVSLEGTPTGSASVPMASFPLQGGSASGTTASLAGGASYTVKAHYSGDGTYKPSDSSPVTVTVAPEPSTTLITIPLFDPKMGIETGNTPSSVVYGTPIAVRVDVGNASAKTTFPPQLVCAPLACPTGSVTVSDSLNGGAPSLLSPSSGFPLGSGGYAIDYNVPLLMGGSYQFLASYPGDNSYKSSTGNYGLVVTPAPTQMSPPYIPFSPQIAGSPVTIGADVNTSLFNSAEPTGTIAFYDGSMPISGTVTYSGWTGSQGSHALLNGSITATFTTSGTHAITAKYNGDANYAAATSDSTNASVVYSTTAVGTVDPTSINLGQSVSITTTVTSSRKNPPMTGSFQFIDATPAIPGQIIGTPSTDASGNQILTATVTTTPQFSESVQAIYSGDANYAQSFAWINVNVILPDFNMGMTSSTLTISAGQSGSTQLTLTPKTNIPSSVALSCNLDALAGASCSFNPASPLNLSNSAAASTMVTITTLPPSTSPTTTIIGIPRPGPKQTPPLGLWILGVAEGLGILVLFLLAGQRGDRLATRYGMIGLLCLVLGCGASNGSGGGGDNSGPSPTSLTLTTSAVKVPNGTNVTFTATVHSSQSATGAIDLFDSSTCCAFAAANVVNGAATFQIPYLEVGTHVISAQYFGDSSHQPSKTSGSINQVITGNADIFVNGTSPGLFNSTRITVTIQ
jgi:hypothetical protein